MSKKIKSMGKRVACEFCGSTAVLNHGSDRYCAGCYEAGANGSTELWEALQKHIKKEKKE